MRNSQEIRRAISLALVACFAALLVGCGDDDSPGKKTVRNDADVVVSEFEGPRFEVPRRPIAVAAGEGAVWVASMAGGVVTKIDPETGERVGKPIETDDSPYSIDVAFGRVWVAAFQNDKLIQIDPDSRKVIKTTKLRNRPFGLTNGFGSLWVTSIRGETLSRIDPDSGEPTGKPIQLSGPPHQIAAGEDFVWVTNIRDGLVDKIDPETNQLVDSYKVGVSPSAVITAAGSVWVANVSRDELVKDEATGRNKIFKRPATVWRLDPKTGERIGSPIEVPVRPYAMAGDDENVWVVSLDGDTLLRIDAKTGKRDKLPVGIGNAPTDVALGFDRVWVPLSREDELAEYDPTTR